MRWSMRVLLGAALLALAASGGAARADEEEVYLTPAEALRRIFPAGEAIERAEVAIGPEERARIEARLGFPLVESALVIERGRRADGTASGYAVVTEEVGKYRPITFIVGVGADGAVKEVAVMVYRESHGSDVKRRRFLAQFDGKTAADPIRQNRDIVNISGATLSVRAVARGVRKVLVALDELVTGPHARKDIAWRPFAEGGPAGGGERRSSSAAPVRRARYLMGTILEGTAYGAGAAAALEAAFDEVARLERLLSTWIPESELSRVNREAAAGAVPVSPETFACVAAALAAAHRSGGAFDPTLTAGGHEAVILDPAARTIRFARAGLSLDLGGIGKGFALDRAAAVLRARGAERAALNFGGQVLALDPPPGEAGWLVAVRDPAGPEGATIGCVEVARASVSTSGQYERPGHIVDPTSGRAAAGMLQATVVAPDATSADWLSTAVFVLGPEAGPRLAAGLPGVRAIVLPRAGAEPLVVGAP
jgi:thiamine biosynthesis lipoprotein